LEAGRRRDELIARTAFLTRGSDQSRDRKGAVKARKPIRAVEAPKRNLSLDALRGFIMLVLVSAGFGLPATPSLLRTMRSSAVPLLPTAL
jgi:hypothetical protein